MFDAKALASIIEGGGVQFRQNAISFIFDCPRCLKSRKLYVRKKDGRFVCFVCRETSNFKGRAEYALKELYGLPASEFARKLYGDDTTDLYVDELALELDDIWGTEDGEILVDPAPPELMWNPDFVSPSGAAQRYLESRGLTSEQVIKYDVRFDPTEQRVVIPIKINDKLIGWQARYIHQTDFWDEETCRQVKIPKILTSESLRGTGGRYLMFQDNLLNSKHCVLAEGPFSALAAELCGGNVASMGKAVTIRQLNTILGYGVKRLYLALDPDAAEEIVRILDDMDPEVETYLLLPPDGYEDLGATPQKLVFEQFKRAPRVRRGALMFSLGNSFIF